MHRPESLSDSWVRLFMTFLGLTAVIFNYCCCSTLVELHFTAADGHDHYSVDFLVVCNLLAYFIIIIDECNKKMKLESDRDRYL